MSQTSTRVGWNGGLGGWVRRQCWGYMDFAPFIHSPQYAAEPLLRPTALRVLDQVIPSRCSPTQVAEAAQDVVPTGRKEFCVLSDKTMDLCLQQL